MLGRDGFIEGFDVFFLDERLESVGIVEVHIGLFFQQCERLLKVVVSTIDVLLDQRKSGLSGSKTTME